MIKRNTGGSSKASPGDTRDVTSTQQIDACGQGVFKLHSDDGSVLVSRCARLGFASPRGQRTNHTLPLTIVHEAIVVCVKLGVECVNPLRRHIRADAVRRLILLYDDVDASALRIFCLHGILELRLSRTCVFSTLDDDTGRQGRELRPQRCDTRLLSKFELARNHLMNLVLRESLIGQLRKRVCIFAFLLLLLLVLEQQFVRLDCRSPGGRGEANSFGRCSLSNIEIRPAGIR